MKHVLIALAITTLCISASAAEPAVAKTTKTVCKDVIGKDNKPVKNKDGSTKQACKIVKIHKKHEGTEIPPKK